MLTAIGDVMQRCYERGWITTRDGNASVRRKGSNHIYITPSGARKNTIRVEDLVKMKVAGNELIVPEGTKPSGELHMHWLLLRDKEYTTAVLHVHPTHVVAALYAGFDLKKLAAEFPEIHRYTRVGPNVPNLPAVSEELANATFLAMCPSGNLEYDIVGQANHGVCSIARDPWAAYEHVERLDHICEIALKSGVRPK